MKSLEITNLEVIEELTQDQPNLIYGGVTFSWGIGLDWEGAGIPFLGGTLTPSFSIGLSDEIDLNP